MLAIKCIKVYHFAFEIINDLSIWKIPSLYRLVLDEVMARNNCPHLQTIFQVNPVELCIQKKVKNQKIEDTDYHCMEFQKTHDCITAKQSSTQQNRKKKSINLHFDTHIEICIIMSVLPRPLIHPSRFLSFSGKALRKLLRTWT